MNKQNTFEASWQPIETAPKEGLFIVTGGAISDDLYRDDASYHMVIVKAQDEGHVSYYEVNDTCYYSVWVEDPTHWMPLPPLPDNN